MVELIIMHCTTCISPAIRDDLGSCARRNDFMEQATRKHFITRQDCRNIGRKVKDFSKHRHNDDAVSVDRIVRELQQETPSPVLTYKPQGIADHAIGLPDDTFFLALMTEFQARLFQDFSEKVVCLDSTHKTNQYKHKLITLMVADEFHNGKTLPFVMHAKCIIIINL